MPRVLIILITAVISFAAHADFFCMKQNFAANESALEGHISNVQQDSVGFLWFATWNGLVRFDGYNFHVFQPILFSDGNIDSNRIYNIRISSSGDIWCVSSDNCLYLFDRDSMKFQNLHKRIPEISDKKVKVITPMKNGVTWIVFKDFTALRLNDNAPLDGYRFIGDADNVTKSNPRINSISRTDIGDEWFIADNKARNITRGYSVTGMYRSVYSLNGSNMLIANDGSIVRTDLKGNKIDKYIFDSAGPLVVNYTLSVDNRIVMATNRGVLIFNPSNDKFTSYGDFPVTYIFKDSRHRIWCFGENAVTGLIENINEDKFDILRSRQSSTKEVIKNPQIIFEQPSGEIILCPIGGVLSYYDESNGEIRDCIFQENESYWSNYSPEGIKKFLVDNDSNLWVFHENGADCINFKKRLFDHANNKTGQETRALAVDKSGRYWLADRSNQLRITDSTLDDGLYIDSDGRVGSAPAQFSRMAIYSILAAPDGDVWVGTKGDGLYLLKPKSGRDNAYDVSHFTASAKDRSLRTPTDTIYDIAIAEGNVWLGSYGNGLSVGVPTASGYRFSHVKNQPAGMKIRSIHYHGNNTLVLGTADGLVTVDIKNLNAPRFFINRFRKEDWGLKGNDVMGVINCNDSLYVCVFGNGLSRIDSGNLLSDELHFTNFPIPSSASAGQIKTAMTDGSSIWVVSEKSISKFSPRTGLYTIYDKDNFMGHFGLSEAKPVLADGCFIVGTTDGVMRFNPDDTELNECDNRRIAITGIRYQNDMEIHPLNDTDSIILSPDRRSFALYLSAMKFGGENNIRFRYRLEGYDQGWNYASENHPEITYNNLRPGHYNLIIECTGPDGAWQQSARNIYLYAKPRFTETTMFKVIIALICALAICSLGYATIYFKKMRNEIQKKYSLLMSIDHISRNYKAEKAEETPLEEPDEESLDKKFIEESVKFINENIDNPELVVEDLARNAGMSRTAYFNRMKHITGLSPIGFIKQMRIKSALQLLEQEKSMSITDIAYHVGFTDPKYFSRCFKSEMGLTPSQYIESRKDSNQ